MNDPKVRAFRKFDYEYLKVWWDGRHPIVALEDLPQAQYVLEVDGEPKMVLALILTNAKFCLVEGLAADPESSWEDREYWIGILCFNICAVAKQLGYKRILLFPDKARIAEKFKVAGFTVMDDKNFACVKEL